jgi:hypothetical protein
MDIALLKATVALVPVCMLFFGSAVMFFRGKTAPLFLQLFGAGCLLVVVFTHVFEAVCTENLIRIDCVTESPKRQRR